MILRMNTVLDLKQFWKGLDVQGLQGFLFKWGNVYILFLSTCCNSSDLFALNQSISYVLLIEAFCIRLMLNNLKVVCAASKISSKH